MYTVLLPHTVLYTCPVIIHTSTVSYSYTCTQDTVYYVDTHMHCPIVGHAHTPMPTYWTHKHTVLFVDMSCWTLSKICIPIVRELHAGDVTCYVKGKN